VAPALAELLMVLVMLVMAVSLYFMFTAIATNAAPIASAVTLRDTGAVQGGAPGYCCLNDTTLEVVAALGDAPSWGSAVEFAIVSSRTGTMLVQGYIEAEPPDANLLYLGVFHGSDDEPSVINIWYIDSDRDGLVTVSDHISVRGMSKEFHGADFRLVADGRVIGLRPLP